MAKAVLDQALVALDNDPALMRDISRALGQRFTVLFTADSHRATELMQREQSIKLVMVGQMVRGVSGLKILETAMQVRPEARRVLITSYGDLAPLMHGIHNGTIHRTLCQSSLHEELALLGTLGASGHAGGYGPRPTLNHAFRTDYRTLGYVDVARSHTP